MSDNTPKRVPLRIPFDRKNTILLTSLVHANPKQRRAILQHSDSKFIHCICEIILNYLKGVLPIKDKEKRKLKKYKKILRQLISKISWAAKKKIIIKHCIGILALLITPIINLLFKNLA